MNRERVHQVNDETFIKIVSESDNTHEALIKMGLNGFGAAYKIFNERCRKLNLNLSHFTSNKKLRKQLIDSDVANAVKSNISRMSALEMLGLRPDTNSNVRFINSRISMLNLDTSHWLGQGHLKGKTHNWSDKIPMSDILVKDSSYQNSHALKSRLLKEGLLVYECYNCKLKDWLEKPISLQLEHKNGDHSDNRIENLCLLCPNCHSQTPTFCRGKSSFDNKDQNNKEKYPVKKKYLSKRNCPICNKSEINVASSMCRACQNKIMKRKTKIEWPSAEELIKLTQEKGFVQIGKILGVSDNAVRKRIKNHRIK